MSAREDLERIRTIIEEIETNGYAEMSVGGKRFKTHDALMMRKVIERHPTCHGSDDEHTR